MLNNIIEINILSAFINSGYKTITEDMIEEAVDHALTKEHNVKHVTITDSFRDEYLLEGIDAAYVTRKEYNGYVTIARRCANKIKDLFSTH